MFVWRSSIIRRSICYSNILGNCVLVLIDQNACKIYSGENNTIGYSYTQFPARQYFM